MKDLIIDSTIVVLIAIAIVTVVFLLGAILIMCAIEASHGPLLGALAAGAFGAACTWCLFRMPRLNPRRR